jgi:hypothetical protein
MSGGRFSWIKYTFRAGTGILSQEQYLALKQMNKSELERYIAGVRKDGWDKFCKQHEIHIYATVAAVVSTGLVFITPLLGLIAFLLWIFPISLMFSAITRATSLKREGRFYRLAHKIAQETSTYETFNEVYSRKVLKS